MKKNLTISKIIALLFISFLLWSCNGDDIEEIKIDNDTVIQRDYEQGEYQEWEVWFKAAGWVAAKWSELVKQESWIDFSK